MSITQTAAPRPAELAHEVLDALRGTRQITPFSERVDGFDVPFGYAVAADLRALRGEKIVGRKIGFTNRTLWRRYGVDAPMWGDMTEQSVTSIDSGPVDLSRFLEPKLEPEVALKLSAEPRADMDDETLLSTVEWIAPAFEVVQSIYPGWRFALADCAAANGLHGALLLGPPKTPGPWALRMPSISLDLYQGKMLVETGFGHSVLGGPLNSLRHLIETLLADGTAPLGKGEIVTTGTLTDAQALTPGDTWSARFRNSPLDTIEARFC
ncbi:MAG: hydratase [Pseudomonadota bacterium]